MKRACQYFCVSARLINKACNAYIQLIFFIISIFLFLFYSLYMLTETIVL